MHPQDPQTAPSPPDREATGAVERAESARRRGSGRFTLWTIYVGMALGVGALAFVALSGSSRGIPTANLPPDPRLPGMPRDDSARAPTIVTGVTGAAGPPSTGVPARLVVTAEAGAVDLTLDGAPLGRTPGRFAVAPGRHTLHAHRADLDRTETLEVPPGATLTRRF